MPRLTLTVVLVAALVFALIALYPPQSQRQTPTDIADYLGGDADHGFARAWQPRQFHFPEDHGPHSQYKTEWWYYTGNLSTVQGRHFGYQLTFFRIGLAPGEAARPSAWGTNQIYMAHFTVTDVQAQAFHPFQRFSRAALDLAGASAAPFRVWLEDWSVTSSGKTFLPLRITARADDVAIDLSLESAKPPVLQGEHGLSQKSETPGNASYYYSYTRMPTRGIIRLGANTYEVSGLSWMDREWSTSALGNDQAGWDWFSLQFDSGDELMYYQLRRKDGGVDPVSSGSWISKDGAKRNLAAADVELTVLDHWRSAASDAHYPSAWRLRVANVGLDVTVTPYVQNQELNLAVRYWEGAVRVRGTLAGEAISGSGYTELTGYGDIAP